MPVLYLLLVFLHIAVMFAAVALTYGPETLILMSIRANNAAWLRGITIATEPLARYVPMLFGLAGIFGLLAAIAGSFNLLAPWLVIAYVIFLALSINGAVLTARNLTLMRNGLATVTDGPLPADVAAVANGASFRFAAVLDFTLLLVVVFDMVVKPFS